MGPSLSSLTTQDSQRVILWFHWLMLLCIWHFHKNLFFEKSKVHVISFWFLFFLESSVLGMAAGCIQVFRSHMLLNFSVCTQWSCSFSLRNVASNSPAFALAALFPGLIPLAERSVVLVPYIVLSCLLCCCSCAPPQHVCPQSSHELTLDFQRLKANGQIFCFYTFMFLFLWYISPVPH